MARGAHADVTHGAGYPVTADPTVPHPNEAPCVDQLFTPHTPPLNPSDLETLKNAVDFDSMFTKVLHDDQEDTIAETSAAYDTTQDAKLRALLGEIIPTLRAHRDMAKLIMDQNAPRAAL